jgi:hypothetical protein
MPTVIIHIQNEDAVLGEMDNLPTPNDTLLFVKNPRKRDGKDLTYVDPTVSTVIWPLTRINFIEIVPIGTEEEMISFVRE